MAALSPRSFLALVIPAIVVALGYYWFKKRAEETKYKQKQVKKRHKNGINSVANCSDVVASSKQVDCMGELPVESERLPPVGAERTVDDVVTMDDAFSSPMVHNPIAEHPQERDFLEGVKEDVVPPTVDSIEQVSVQLNNSPISGSEVSSPCRDFCEKCTTDVSMNDKPLSKESVSSVSSVLDSSSVHQGESSDVDITNGIHDFARTYAGADSRQILDEVNDTTQNSEETTLCVDQIYEGSTETMQSDVTLVSESSSLETTTESTLELNHSVPDGDKLEDNSSELQSSPSEIICVNSSSKNFLLEGIAEAIEELKLLHVESEKTDQVEEQPDADLVLNTEASTIRTELECTAAEENSVVASPEVTVEPVTSRCSNVGVLENTELQRCSVATDSDINTSAYGTANHSPSEDMLESPAASNFSDIHSEGSTDSGKSAGELLMPGLEMGPVAAAQDVNFYEFEIAQELCGRLIGKQGATISSIKQTSRANIYIKRHPYSSHLKLCVVSGSSASIEKALQLIRKKFPVNKYSGVSLLQINGQGVPVPDTLQLHLPEGIMCDVILSSLINGGHFFLQQPTHPTYPALSRLDRDMLTCYTQIATPELPRPVDAGVICAAPMMEGWYRAQVSAIYPETDECDIKFVDYGGYTRLPISSLRQIRSDFMLLPFQASECYLANVVPLDEEVSWTMEAFTTFEELAQGQILQAQVVAYAEDLIPFVHLFRIQGATTTFINRELVTRGVAQWIEHEM